MSNYLLDMSFKDFYLFIIRERGREAEREGDKHRLVASHTPLTRHLSHNPGMCPDWELNLQHVVLQDNAQSTEPHQSGINIYFYYICS